VFLALATSVAACTGYAEDRGAGSTTTPGAPSGPGVPGSNNPGGGGNPSVPGQPSTPGATAPGASGGNPGAPVLPGSVSAQVACPAGNSETVGRRVLRRLTGAELEATVRAAFNLTATEWKGPTIPPDPASFDGFNNNVDRLVVGPDYARGMQDTAREVAKVVAAQPRLSTILPCSTQPGDGLTLLPCAQTFVNQIGPKLYRRPLTMAEQARYSDLFMKTGRGEFKIFAHWAVFTMLQSPNVLYRTELGKMGTDGRYTLTPYEVASALSYMFTGGPPTPDLMAAAAAGKLATPDQLEAAAKALVYDANQQVKPAFRQTMQRFSDDWLGLSSLSNITKDTKLYPDFTSDIQDSMAEEARRFLASLMFDDHGTPATLLTAPYTFVNDKLSKFYGIPGGGADFVKVNRPPEWGVGVLAQASMLSVEAHSSDTSPTKRGYFVRTRLLCNTVPPPPPVVGDLPASTGADTTRQRYESLHAVNPSCKGCHTLLDPIGFAFEHLDATGRYRAKENNFDIDDSSTVSGTSAGDLKFKGPTELAAGLAKLPEVSSCMASYMAAYAFGLSQQNASCLVRTATNDLKAGMSIVDFYIRMVRSAHFTSRMP
jgi:hypothetical protein